jgi:hypothetical protein
VEARLAAALTAVALMIPAAAAAGDNPWTMIRQLFHEPVSELKGQLQQLRPPAKATTVSKPKAGLANAGTTEASGSATAAPIPIARPTPGDIVAPAKDVSTAAQSDPVETSAPRSAAAAPSEVAAPAVKAAPPEAMAPLTAGTPATIALAPIPRPRPDTAIPYDEVRPAPPGTKSAAAIGALVGPLPSLTKPPPAARSTCGVALARLGVEATPLAPISEGVCAVPEPVAVAALGGGATDLTTRAIVDCALAEAFANWLRDEAQPAARKILGGDIVGMRVAASYTCRSRNGVAGAKLSEHGRGNAIDISAFNVAGRGWVEVGRTRGIAEARFLRTIRAAACGPFKTVLGPGSDTYHSDHFHFDLAQRSKRGPSRGLYCR